MVKPAHEEHVSAERCASGVERGLRAAAAVKVYARPTVFGSSAVRVMIFSSAVCCYYCCYYRCYHTANTAAATAATAVTATTAATSATAATYYYDAGRFVTT